MPAADPPPSSSAPPDQAASPAAPVAVSARADETKPSRHGILRLSAPIATIAVAAVLGGLAILAVPVHSPLQDCGTSFGFLLNGRTDVFGDPAKPPRGATRADVEATNAKPCRPRVADRAKPAAMLIIGGLVVAVFVAFVEIVARWGDRRRRRYLHPLPAP